MIVGLSGYARTGKDTIGIYLVREWGFRQFAFADLLRDFCWAVNPVIADGGIRWRDPLRMSGYEAAKEQYPEIRAVLQRTGAAARELLDEDVWARPVVELAAEHTRAVITDVRYPNEARLIESYPDGVVARVRRSSMGPVNGHGSETALDDHRFRWSIENDGDLDALFLSVDNLMRELGL